MKFYIASSERNGEFDFIVRWLRSRRQTVYDFKHPVGAQRFTWAQTNAGKPQRPATLALALSDPAAKTEITRTRAAIEDCDVCILVLPAGQSANLVLGYASGRGKTTIVYAPDESYRPRAFARTFEPEVMWGLAQHVVTNSADLRSVVDALIAVRANSCERVAS